jgi:hypothetical protein
VKHPHYIIALWCKNNKEIMAQLAVIKIPNDPKDNAIL